MSGAGRRGVETGTALVEFTWLAILLLVPLLYITLAVFEVQRSAFAASTAARSAGRAYAMAPSEAAGFAHARTAFDLALGDQGLDARKGRLVVTCRPDPANCLAPRSVIQVEVAYPVALPLVPAALGDNTPSIRVQAMHSVPYGTFREDRP